MQDSQAVLFDIHKHFLGPDHVSRWTTEAERKLQTSHYDDERKGWDWDKYVALLKEQHTIIKSLANYGYSGMDDGTKSCHFLKTSRALSWKQHKYVALLKEQHTIIKSLADYGYSGMDDGTKVCHFLKDIKSTELEAAVNAVQSQPEKYAWILMQPYLIWAKWSKKALLCKWSIL